MQGAQAVIESGNEPSLSRLGQVNELRLELVRSPVGDGRRIVPGRNFMGDA